MNKTGNLKFIVLSVTTVFLLTNCASIFSGINQKVYINSAPEKAKITVNGEYRGETPLTVKLRRNRNNNVKIELEGFEPYEVVTRKGFNAVSLGNILIGGAIGMLIDLGTGAVFTVNPDPMYVQLNPQQADTVEIGVTRDMPPEMRESLNKIGELTPLKN